MSELNDTELGRDRLTDRERTKLPVWAKEKLSRARFDAERAERRYRDQLDSTAPTSVCYGDTGDNPKFLPDSQYDRIHMRLDGGTKVYDGVWVEVKRKLDEVTKQPYLEVTTARGIAAVPQATNVVRIYPFRNGKIEDLGKAP